MSTSSLRLRLLRLLVLPIVFSFLLIGVFSYFEAYHEAEEIYDAQLVHYAKVLLELTRHEISEEIPHENILVVDTIKNFHSYEMKFAYRIWKNDKLMLYSSNAEFFGVKIPVEAFSEHTVEGEWWRFFVLIDDDITIEVAENYLLRDDLIEHILEGIFYPQLFIFPVLMLVIWWGVSHGIKPLSHLSDLINKRNPNSLESIDLPIVPAEIVVVVDAINDLMKRISEVMEKEKHFSDYAAHELRTPLAALKTQLQVALRTQDFDKAKSLFGETLPAIDRMQHLVQQLLSFVRVQRHDVLTEVVEFSHLVQYNLVDLAGNASVNKCNLSANIEPNLSVMGNRDMLGILINNLLSNAIKYTTHAGSVEVSLFFKGAKVCLQVSDNGLGISQSHRDKVFDSFYRVSEHQAEGCGLGLSIVKFIADFHDASIEISEGLDNKGTSFTLLFEPYIPEVHS